MLLQPTAILPYTPKRIVSLVPSQTALLYYLGLQKETIGITKFCIHPQEWIKSKTKVGGTKTINIEVVKKLNPDLIIANKEENVKEQIEELANNFNVLVTDVNNVDDALQMIIKIGQLTGKEQIAVSLTEKIKSEFKKILQPEYLIKTAYLIWNKPYMTIGGDTFISDILTKCGLQNIFAHKKRYPQITIADLATAKCQLILLSTEPYPFKQDHINELQLQLPKTKIILVDGEMFSWYGNRMLLMPDYLNALLKAINR
jgi:ABC-type Fe3+-hydroxamate transport system substrate-binding protein